MTRTLKLFAVIVAALVLACTSGCGGSGTALLSAGTYSGSFTTSSSQTGTLTALVTSGGNISGTVHNTTTGEDGAISGSFVDGGTSHLNFIYSSSAVSTTGTLNFTGTALTGTLTDGSGGTYSVTLARG